MKGLPQILRTFPSNVADGTGVLLDSGQPCGTAGHSLSPFAPDRAAIVRSTQSTQTVNCVVEPAARIDTKSNRQEQTAGGWLSACDQASIDVGTTDAPEAHPEVA